MNKTLMGALLTGALAWGLAGNAVAQATPAATEQQQQRELARGEPARWLKEDTSERAQIATKKKEIAAALKESLAECKRMAAGDRGSCVKEARQTYQTDLANVRELVAASNKMGGVHETTGKSE